MDMDNQTFQVAPFLALAASQEACDKDAACVGYVIDGAGARCWVLNNKQRRWCEPYPDLLSHQRLTGKAV
jgi:hypothetical protein